MPVEYNTEYSLQNAIALYYDYTTLVIVDNLSSIIHHEADVFILSKSLYATEVEIKISKSDLKKDSEKWHKHKSNFIKYLYFCFPESMDKQDCYDLVPENAGILIVNNKGFITIRREAPINKFAKKWTYEQSFKLARLASIRYWNLRLRNKNEKE